MLDLNKQVEASESKQSKLMKVIMGMKEKEKFDLFGKKLDELEIKRHQDMEEERMKNEIGRDNLKKSFDESLKRMEERFEAKVRELESQIGNQRKVEAKTEVSKAEEVDNRIAGKINLKEDESDSSSGQAHVQNMKDMFFG